MLKFGFYTALLLLFLTATTQTKQGKKYFDSDSSKIQEVYHYSLEDSTLEGEYESFYFNGSLRIYGWYSKNQPDSAWRYYYENGRKKAEGRFKKGIPSGKWTYYFENGNIKSTGKLKGSSKEGNSDQFDTKLSSLFSKNGHFDSKSQLCLING